MRRPHRVPPSGLASTALGSLLLILLLLTRGMAAEIDVDLRAYRDAAERGSLGTVTGRASALPRSPEAPDGAVSGVEVVVVPRSEALLADLESARRQARASTREYVDAVPEVERARKAFESALGAREAADLVRKTTTDAEGEFTVADLPAGRWLVIASRSVSVAKRPRAVKPQRGRQVFAPPSQLVGYATVTIWVREVSVAAGETETVELTDRAVWLSGVVERRQAPSSPLRPLFE